MASFSRGSFPQNFYDITDSKLLKQPEPQYLFGRWFLDAMNISLGIPSSMGLAGRQVPNVGGQYVTLDADRLELAANLPGELMAVKIDFAGQPGNTMRINRPHYVDSTYTQLSRQVTTATPISTTPITVQSEQTQLTLLRFGGPYDNVSNQIRPYAIEAFDANMGVHSATEITGNNLARDFHKFLDTVHTLLADNASTLVYPDPSYTSDNNITLANSAPATVEWVLRIHEQMDEANLPKLGDGFRVLVITPRQKKQLSLDPTFLQQATFHPEYNVLYPNYWRSVDQFHVFVCNTLQKPLNSSSIAVDHAVALAPGAYMGGMGRKPEVRSSTDDNYGEQAKVIWLADLAFGLADNRFVVSGRTG